MKNKILFPVIIISITLLFFACKKEEVINENTDPGSNRFTVLIDSVFYEAENVSGELTNGNLIITATTGDTLRPYFIFELKSLDEGVYFFNTPRVISAQYYPGFGLNQLFYGVDGNIIIVEHNATSRFIKVNFFISFEEVFGEIIDTQDGSFELTYD